MILHELATNAAKYGTLMAAEGQIELKWSHGADGWLILCWTEMGAPELQTPARQGFGTRITERMVDQLKGKARFDWRPEGLVCEIAFGTWSQISRLPAALGPIEVGAGIGLRICLHDTAVLWMGSSSCRHRRPGSARIMRAEVRF
jgi:hypothetical protein